VCASVSSPSRGTEAVRRFDVILKIRAELDPRRYAAGTQISDAEIASLNLKRSDFHGEWNYTLMPYLK